MIYTDISCTWRKGRAQGNSLDLKIQCHRHIYNCIIWHGWPHIFSPFLPLPRLILPASAYTLALALNTNDSCKRQMLLVFEVLLGSGLWFFFSVETNRAPQLGTESLRS